MEPWPLWKGQRLPRGENHERPTTKMTREVGLGVSGVGPAASLTHSLASSLAICWVRSSAAREAGGRVPSPAQPM